jgi:hypothetical protein
LKRERKKKTKRVIRKTYTKPERVEMKRIVQAVQKIDENPQETFIPKELSHNLKNIVGEGTSLRELTGAPEKSWRRERLRQAVVMSVEILESRLEREKLRRHKDGNKRSKKARLLQVSRKWFTTTCDKECAAVATLAKSIRVWSKGSAACKGEKDAELFVSQNSRFERACLPGSSKRADKHLKTILLAEVERKRKEAVTAPKPKATTRWGFVGDTEHVTAMNRSIPYGFQTYKENDRECYHCRAPISDHVSSQCPLKAAKGAPAPGSVNAKEQARRAHGDSSSGIGKRNGCQAYGIEQTVGKTARCLGGPPVMGPWGVWSK